MKKYFFTIIAIGIAHGLFAQDDIPKSLWVSVPVKTDGIAKEWNQPLRFYDTPTKLFFAFANDAKNLYLCFETNDDMNQMKILRAGMKISLTTRSKHKVSINFPLEQKGSPVPEGNTTTSNNDIVQKYSRENMRNNFLLHNTTMEVKGFTTKEGMIPINDSSGINAAINWDVAGRFAYEITIPLKELLGNNYTAEDMMKDITLHAEVNALTKQGRSSGGGGENAFSGRGGGRRMGGGNGMGGRERSRNSNEEGDEKNPLMQDTDRTALFEKAEMKQKFILAQNNNPG